MAKRRRANRKSKNRSWKREMLHVSGMRASLLVLFVFTVCVVFSFLFTIIMVPLGPIATDLRFIFITLLVVSSTVASAVSLIFYLFFLNR